MDNSIEIWKDIEGYEGMYQVSNMGRVRSLDRVKPNSGGQIAKGHILPHIDGKKQKIDAHDRMTKTDFSENLKRR